MKVAYDRRTDTLSVILKDDTSVAESDEEKPGVILDFSWPSGADWDPLVLYSLVTKRSVETLLAESGGASAESPSR